MTSFEINNQISNNGCWDVLLIDDIYDTNASLAAATRTLSAYEKWIIYLLVLLLG